MMAGTNRTEEEDPARRIARLAGSLHKGVSEHGRKKDKSVKASALHLLALCSERYDAVPPPDELIHLIAYALGLGYDRKTRANPYSMDLVTDGFLRNLGRYFGFSKPQPETVDKIRRLLIPFEAAHAPDPLGNWPSVATHKDVAKHLDVRIDQVKRWRSLPQLKSWVAGKRNMK